MATLVRALPLYPTPSADVDHATLVSALAKDGSLAALPEGVAVRPSSFPISSQHIPAHGPLPSSLLQTERATGSAPAYLGGEFLVRTAGGGPAHVAVAFSAPSLSSKSLHALGVWQALLGGTPSHGGAAGQLRLGPQRLNRIARSVHNEAHSFIQSLTAFALPYSDAGLLGFVGTTSDHEAGRLVHAAAGFLKDSAGQPITPAELDRAKKQYKLALLAQVRAAARWQATGWV